MVVYKVAASSIPSEEMMNPYATSQTLIPRPAAAPAKGVGAARADVVAAADDAGADETGAEAVDDETEVTNFWVVVMLGPA